MRLDVAYASDDNYAYLLGISLFSLLENNKNINEIFIHIMDNGISERNKLKIFEIINKFERNIIYYDISDIRTRLGELTIKGISITSYGRLFLTDLLSDSINQILYLDCDTLVLGSLENLIDFDFKSNLAAGVLDTVNNRFKQEIGLKANDLYFNAGVLLLNIEEMRLKNILAEIKNFILKFENGVPHHDQGVINNIFNNQIKILEPKYNVITTFTQLNAKQLSNLFGLTNFYKNIEIIYAVKNPLICHLTVGFSTRPWFKNSKHYFRKEFIEYKQKTPWSDKILSKDNLKIKVKTINKLFDILPFFLFSPFYKILYKIFGKKIKVTFQ